LNLIIYTVTNGPMLDTWYSFLCLYHNQIWSESVLVCVTYVVVVSAVLIDPS